MLMHSINNNFFIFAPPFINTCSLFAYYHEHTVFAIPKANKFSFLFYLSYLKTNFGKILLFVINNYYSLTALYHNVGVCKRRYHNILWYRLKLFFDLLKNINCFALYFLPICFSSKQPSPTYRIRAKLNNQYGFLCKHSIYPD